MQNGRLSFEAFKAKAENVNTNEVLEKVQGGDWSDCHGFWGAVGKAFTPSDEDPFISGGKPY